VRNEEGAGGKEKGEKREMEKRGKEGSGKRWEVGVLKTRLTASKGNEKENNLNKKTSSRIEN